MLLNRCLKIQKCKTVQTKIRSIFFLIVSLQRKSADDLTEENLHTWLNTGVSLQTPLLYLVVMCRAGQIASRSRTRLWAEWSTLCVKSDSAAPKHLILANFRRLRRPPCPEATPPRG